MRIVWLSSVQNKWPLPVLEMSAKKVVFRMENCGHLPAEVCGVLECFVRKSTQAGNFHIQVRSCLQRGLQMSADINADICGHLCGRLCGRPHGWVRRSADVRMDGCGCLRKSAWMGADICKGKGFVRVAASAV